MTQGIIIGGVTYPLGGLGGEVDVKTWHDHHVEFKPGEGFNKKRKQLITLCVWHWTGSENPPLTMVKTLRQRELGVEFAIDRDGVVWQFCDPMFVDTADSGVVNARSVGVEMVSYGVKSWDRLWTVPKPGANRPVHDVRIHGLKRKVAGFYPTQQTAAIALAEVLSEVLHIPRAVPAQPDGARALTQVELDRFRGHIGHYQITVKKDDPGPVHMQMLADLFAA